MVQLLAEIAEAMGEVTRRNRRTWWRQWRRSGSRSHRMVELVEELVDEGKMFASELSPA
jgi:transposase-like protein